MLETKVVQITGRGSNVNLAIDDSASFDEVISGLRSHLGANPFMYSSGTITVNVGRRMLNKEELTGIKELLEKESGVTVSKFWCPPEILEEALSENVGFGVTLSSQVKAPRPEPPKRQGDIAHNDPMFTLVSSPSDTDQSSGLEQWEAYILEPVQKPTPLIEVQPTEEAPAFTSWEVIPEANQAAVEAPPLEEAEGETPEESASVVPPSGAEPEPEDDTKPYRLPDSSPSTRNAPKREPAGLDRGNEALLIKTNCRSGEVIRYPGDVVIMADVNPGGEVIADGDILVFGNLRGFAHAGASGDIQATIIALNLDTYRLQIGPYTGMDPKPKKRSKSNKSNPRIAYVRRRSVYVAPYAGRFGGYSGGTLYDG